MQHISNVSNQPKQGKILMTYGELALRLGLSPNVQITNVMYMPGGYHSNFPAIQLEGHIEIQYEEKELP